MSHPAIVVPGGMRALFMSIGTVNLWNRLDARHPAGSRRLELTSGEERSPGRWW
jgi:hypothetical protein